MYKIQPIRIAYQKPVNLKFCAPIKINILYVFISRCAVSLLVTGVLAGVGFGMYKLREAEKEK